jgi:hypothetical protein
MEKIEVFFKEFWDIILEMSPFLLFGFLIAGVLSVFLSAEFVKKHLGKNKFSDSVKASLFGVPLPLCSCGVIPVAASLRKSGASKSAVVSFLLSTPQTGVDSIAVTYSLLGTVFAILRPIAAFFAGILGGFITAIFDKDYLKNEEIPEIKCSHDSCEDGSCAINGDDNHHHDHGHIHHHHDHNEKHEITVYNKRSFISKLKSVFKYAFVILPKDLNKELLIGLVAAGAISAFVPNDFFASYLGGNSPYSKFVMLIVGIPIYICATSSVPIAASLILKGISPGAVFVFLMAGPGTNAATFTVITKVIGKKATYIYLAVLSFVAVVFGYIIDAFYYNDVKSALFKGKMLPYEIKLVSAVALILIIVLSFFKFRKKEENNEKNFKYSFDLKGITCEHCVSNVEKAVSSLGVGEVRVSLKKKKLYINEYVEFEKLEYVIKKAGYDIEK